MIDTIFALASGAGRAGVAVLRVSGSRAVAILEALTQKPCPPARQANLAKLRHKGEVLDEALVLFFAGPKSFTGDDVVELHVHGGPAVIASVSQACMDLGARPAQRGEFTRRAFESGRIDLTEAEALADLVNSETPSQQRQALRQMDGALADQIESWRERLVRAMAHLEAVIDFSDEDIPDDLHQQVWADAESLIAEISRHLTDAKRGERIRDGLRIAILGAPNVGKSSLLNRLARRDVAIVSATAGTTRDVIEVHLDLAGFAVIVSDTAGLREAGEDIEAEGIRRALARAQEADITLILFDASTSGDVWDQTSVNLIDERALIVVNKMDQSGARPVHIGSHECLGISAKSGQGIDDLLAVLTDRVREILGGREAPLLTRARHQDALTEAVSILGRLAETREIELAAEEMRLAARALGRVTGRVDVEELLDVIFRDFCIGK